MVSSRHHIAALAALATLAALGLLAGDPAASSGGGALDPAHRALRAALSQGRREVNAHARIRNLAMLEVDEAGARLQAAGEGRGGMCFDDQPRDAWMTSRMICGEDLPSEYGVPGSASAAALEGAKSDASVAICVVGKTRSFTSPLAQETLRANLASAFGAGHTAFYFHLFPQDMRGDSTRKYSAVAHSDVRQSADAALRVLRMEEGDFAKSEQDGVHRWTSDACGAEIVVDGRGDGDVYASNMESFAASRPIGEFSPYFSTRDEAFHRGFVAQWTGVRDCYEFVRREEERRGRKFDYVIRTRPDMVYSKSLKPHCLYSPRNVWMQHDWLYVLPRQVLDYLHKVYQEGVMTDANPDFASTAEFENPEGYLFRLINAAKSRAEFDYDGCCDEENRPRRNDMVAGGMLLRPKGKHFPRNVCYFPNDFGTPDDCLNLLQDNRYNVPAVHEATE